MKIMRAGDGWRRAEARPRKKNSTRSSESQPKRGRDPQPRLERAWGTPSGADRGIRLRQNAAGGYYRQAARSRAQTLPGAPRRAPCRSTGGAHPEAREGSPARGDQEQGAALAANQPKRLFPEGRGGAMWPWK
jgi:hypothetical protein